MKPTRQSLVQLLLVLLAALAISAQIPGTNAYTLGRKSLVRYAAPTLAETAPIHFAILDDAYLNRIGGVAFDQIAVPRMPPGECALTYIASRQDGGRLRVRIGGADATANLPDWQLIPIARYANTDFYAALTAAGSLHNTAKERELKRQGAQIVNYHSAFDNTLLGLRLLQLDMLIALEDSTDLPKLNGGYILGLGEKEPNLEVARRAFASVSKDSGFHWSRMGYLISDHGTSVSVEIKAGQLIWNGLPRYNVFEESTGGHAPQPRINDWLSKNLETVSKINPDVWLSGVRVMRYAALFRFYRANYPDAWGRFYKSISGVNPEPRVWTPTAIVDLG